ncbi:transketolase [Aerococcus kribbianus]|uniref:Transketolase n=1 Tax=Aerococcus kribbianus TaxID=2999064 RepID=A0A9X3FV64_9LACT|nr:MULTISPECIES: transketolase [unclassified Aerococcus]MCZ0717536.1 transketolase [Aerococcus sp. YH-aer221]MCZ0725824.1 transketolase [Aerococcus sp. YH-aer222]
MVEQVKLDAINAIRTLSMDMIDEAGSGHPGLPMGAAPMAYVLWANHMHQNPLESHWTNRDRFVLSAGHGSAMLYSMLHLSGYQISLEDLKNFRQYESKTPGHPEVHYTDGVEATTGPLGQGIGNAVGMAMAEAHDAAIYNTDAHKIVDHYTFALCGDGDLMEGVSQEAASLAGHLKLGKLIMLYDSNDISLDGPTSKAFTENVGDRFQAYGWQYLRVEDGNDLDAIDAAISQAKENTDQPTLIEVKTVIGYGAENQGTSQVHGAPLGEEGSAFAKSNYGWKYDRFDIPQAIYNHFHEVILEDGKQAMADWQATFNDYQEENPDLAKQFLRAYSGELPADWDKDLPVYQYGDEAKASRKTSQAAIQAIGKALPEFWGGSADLSSSNNTMNDEDQDFQAGQYQGRNIWYGVREFAMGAAMNGIALHGGSKTYAGTFFVFSDYVRPAIRLAALSHLPVTYVFTHDSIGVGEDGPTHEPVEQLASFRAMHNVNVIRPADGNEVNAAWRIALNATDRPNLLVLSRQNLPVLENSQELAATGVERGAYVISPAQGQKPEGILIATGSEVALAIEAQKQLLDAGHDVQVVSMPSQELFNEQDSSYQESVLPAAVTKRLAIEMGSSFGWERYVGLNGKVLGIDNFGASGKGQVVQEAYGFTPENVVATYQSL